MAIDTREKRASLIGVAIPMLVGVTPDATPDQAWRQAAGWGYYGILVSGSVQPTIPSVLGDLTTLWTQDYQPALHALDPGDDTTLIALDEANLLNYDTSRDKNTDAAKYIDTEF